MKMQADTTSGPTMTGYGPDWVAVNGVRHTESLVVSAAGAIRPWGVAGFNALEQSHFDQLLTLEPELIVFGSGSSLRFPKPVWLVALYARRIGVETMDTQAACRTYNFLAGEGRKVVAALLL